MSFSLPHQSHPGADKIFARPQPIRFITSFQTIVLLVVLAHVGALVGVLLSPVGFKALLSLNALVALAVLAYAASRAAYIVRARDLPFLALAVFELATLLLAICAWPGNRTWAIVSSVAFGLHGCISIAALVYAFFGKINRLF